MKTINHLTLTTSPKSLYARKPLKTANLALRQRPLHGRKRHYHTGKERDSETGLYYYGARYLDPKASRWLSGDPTVGEYIPQAGADNSRLPNGGVYNSASLHAYNYSNNNPVKYVDPDGRAPRDLTTGQRNRYMEAITTLKNNLQTIPRGYDCTDVALYAYTRGIQAATGERDAWKRMYHGGVLLSQAIYGLTDIQAVDQHPNKGNKNVLFYDGSGNGGPMAYSQTVYDTSFDSTNIEIGTVAILEPYNSPGGFTGHTMTVAEIVTGINGVRQEIKFIEGGMTHDPLILTVRRGESLDIYSDTKFIGWAEWRSTDY